MRCAVADISSDDAFTQSLGYLGAANLAACRAVAIQWKLWSGHDVLWRPHVLRSCPAVEALDQAFVVRVSMCSLYCRRRELDALEEINWCPSRFARALRDLGDSLLLGLHFWRRHRLFRDPRLVWHPGNTELYRTRYPFWLSSVGLLWCRRCDAVARRRLRLRTFID